MRKTRHGPSACPPPLATALHSLSARLLLPTCSSLCMICCILIISSDIGLMSCLLKSRSGGLLLPDSTPDEVQGVGSNDLLSPPSSCSSGCSQPSAFDPVRSFGVATARSAAHGHRLLVPYRLLTGSQSVYTLRMWIIYTSCGTKSTTARTSESMASPLRRPDLPSSMKTHALHTIHSIQAGRTGPSCLA